MLHILSHPGVRATINLIAKRFHWPGVSEDVREWTRYCADCWKSRVIRHNKYRLGSYKTPDAHSEQFLSDLIELLPDSH